MGPKGWSSGERPELDPDVLEPSGWRGGHGPGVSGRERRDAGEVPKTVTSYRTKGPAEREEGMGRRVFPTEGKEREGASRSGDASQMDGGCVLIGRTLAPGEEDGQ